MRAPKLGGQAGGSLILVLVLLAVMLIGTVTMINTTGLSAAMAGNAAFRQGATGAAQFGIDAGAQLIRALAAPDNNAAGYYATRRPSDAFGLPDVGWDSQPEIVQGMYSVRWLVERLCSKTPVVDPTTDCSGYTLVAASSSKVGATTYAQGGGIYYRVTVRVMGPKNTESYVQASFAR